MRAIPRVFTGFRSGAGILVNHQLPTLIGGTSSCGHDVVPPLVSDAALLALLAALVWMRRQSIFNVLTGRVSQFEPLDVVLVLIPATIAYLVVSRLDGLECEPRYTMPLTVPLAVALTAILTVRWPWRALRLIVAGAWLWVSAVAAAAPL